MAPAHPHGRHRRHPRPPRWGGFPGYWGNRGQRDIIPISFVVDLTGRKVGITDPRFNLREIVKQMTLLEQHLCDPLKRCPECINKHLFTIEGLAEEAVQMDNSFQFGWLTIVKQWAQMMQSALLHSRGTLCDKMGAETRQVRKHLQQLYMASLSMP